MARTRIIFVIFVVILVYALIFCSFSSKKQRKGSVFQNSTQNVFVTVACGDRTNEALVMIKSALMFSSVNHPLKFVVITETDLFEKLEEKLTTFSHKYSHFSYSLLKTTFPDEKWRKLFKPCAAQRLFLPSMLQLDRVIYLDSDIIFLSPPHELHQFFRRFNHSQLAGMTAETESEGIGWYPRFARHPFYGKFGINSGVMLMDLKMMREQKWEQQLEPIYEHFKFRIVFGDQDLINIYFSLNPHQLFMLPCEVNFRPDHCMYMQMCDALDGIKLIHGNRGYFHKNENEPVFSQIYSAIQKVRLKLGPFSR